MNKDQLIDEIVNKTRHPKNQISEIFEEIFNTIIERLEKNQEINIVGFGKFQVVTRKGRKGADPRTGKEIEIKDVKVAKFRTGKRLKDAVK